MRRWGTILTALCAAAGAGVSVFNYLDRASGIAGTPGALLVIGSCLAIFAAALVILSLSNRFRWFSRTLFVLIFLGILGTAFAAYLLESAWLLAAVAGCFLGWLAASLGRHHGGLVSTSSATQ